MGSCPAYTVTASTDDVDFEGRWYVVATGKHVAPVDPDAVRKLAKEAITRDFYSMAPQYEANVTDCPSYTLSLSVDGVRKQVIDYMGMWEGMPAVISDLEEAVDDLAGTERWTQGKVGLVSALKAEKWDFATFGAQQMLKQAAVRGQVDSVRELLEAGVPLKPVPEPKLVSADPRTSALNEGWLQAASGHRDVLEVLLAAGASKDDQLDKNLALSNAASTGDITAARALIAYGANPNADLSKLTVVEGRSMSSSGPGLGNILTYAAESGNPAMVSEILKYRPKLETHGREGKTAIFAAAEYEGDATDEDRAECVRLLAKAGANVNAHDSDGNTPLHETFLVPVIEELISLGANVNARNKDGETPIFTNVSAEAMAVFAAHGADFTVRNHKGQTVIEAAEQRGPIMQEALLAAMRSQLGR
jgi:ankyrin repeat protein